MPVIAMFHKNVFTEKFQSIRDRLKTLFELYIEKAKLTLAERLTLLMSAAIILFVCALLCIMGLAFLSGSLVMLFSLCLPEIAAWAIVGGIYFLIALIIILLRKPLVINPVARFISQLIIGNEEADKPEPEEAKNRFNQ